MGYAPLAGAVVIISGAEEDRDVIGHIAARIHAVARDYRRRAVDGLIVPFFGHKIVVAVAEIHVDDAVAEFVIGASGESGILPSRSDNLALT